MWKKFFVFMIALLSILIVSIASLAAYLYKNQDVLARYALQELNDMMQGYTRLGGVKIDVFTNFPYISIDLQDLALYASESDTLQPIYRFNDVYLGFNYTDIVAGSYKVKKIKIKQGEINIEKHEDGSINLLLAKSLKEKAEENASENSKFSLKLKKLVLDNLQVTKTDYQSKQYLHLHFKKAESSFKFNEELLLNKLDTHFELVELRIQDSVWLKNKQLHWETDLEYQFANSLLRIRPSRFEIKDAQFELQGTVDFARNAFLDLEIFGRKPDFRLITAFAPEGVYEKLKSYQNSGDVYFKGKVKGASVDAIPRIDLEFGCKNADFINPNRKNSIRDLNFTGFFTNGEERHLRTSELLIKSLSGNPEESVFKGSFHIKNFENPLVSIDFHSRLNLATLQNFFEIEALKGLSGWLIIDMTLDELMDYYDTPTALGKLKDGSDSRLIFEKVHLQSPDLPYPVRFNGRMEIASSKLIFKNFLANLGQSDFRVDGEVVNLAAFLHGEEAPFAAELKGSSKKILLKELLSFDKALAAQQEEEISDLRYHLAFNTTTTELKKKEGLPKGEFSVKEFFVKLKHYPHHFHDWHIDLLLEEDKINIKQFEGQVDNSDFRLSGYLDNYRALQDSTRSKQDVALKLLLQSAQLHFDDLFVYKNKNYMPAEYQHETLSRLLLDMSLQIPAKSLLQGDWKANTRLQLRQLDGQLKLHSYGLRKLQAEVDIVQSRLQVRDFKGQMGTTDFRIQAEVENIAKLMEADFKGKKSLYLQANQLNFNELLSQAELEKSHDTLKNTEEHAQAFNIFELPFPNLDFQTDIGELRYGKYHLKQLKAALRIEPSHKVYIDRFDTYTAGGKLSIKGYLNATDAKKIYFSSTIQAQEMDMDKMFYKMDNFGQDYLLNENLHGKLSGTIQSKVLLHPDLVVNLRDTEAHIEATIREGRLTNFAPFKMMDRFMAGKDLENVRFGEMNNVIDVKNGEISIPRMEISSSLGYMMISGKQNFDNDLQMSYLVEVPAFVIKDALWNHLSRKRRERRQREQQQRQSQGEEEAIISSEDRQSRQLATVRIEGRPDNIDFSFQGFRKNR